MKKLQVAMILSAVVLSLSLLVVGQGGSQNLDKQQAQATTGNGTQQSTPAKSVAQSGKASPVTRAARAQTRYEIFQEIHSQKGDDGSGFNILPSKLRNTPYFIVFDLVKNPDEKVGVTNLDADWGPFTAPASRKIRVAVQLSSWWVGSTGETKVSINGVTVLHIADYASIPPLPPEISKLLAGVSADGNYRVAVSPEIDLSTVDGESQYSVTIESLDSTKWIGTASVQAPNYPIVRVWLLHAAAPVH